MPDPKPSVWRLLISSRKNVIGALTAVATVAVMIGAHYGLDWSVPAIVTAWSPVVLLAMSVIFGIAYEDGQQKAAGAGTTTTVKPDDAGGTEIKTTGEPGKS